MTQADMLSRWIGGLAQRYRRLTLVILVAAFVVAIAGAALAAAALVAGPVGPELLKGFRDWPLSRLAVVQIGSGLSALSLVLAATVFLSWAGVPGWLRGVAETLARSASGDCAFWVPVLLGMAWAAFAMLTVAPPLACLEPDTVGYLVPNAIRSAGYMVFLKAVVAATGDLRWLGPVQLALMLASFVALGWSTRRLLDGPVAGALVAMAPMLSPPLLILAPAVMTEAVFVALICAHAALALRLLRRASLVDAALCGLALGAMIVVRPNGISFLAGIPLLLVLVTRRRLAVGTMIALPVAVLVLAQCGYNQATFGFFGLHRFGGISLAGNAAPLIRADMTTAHPALAAALDDSLHRYYVDFPPEKMRFPFQKADAASLTTVGAIYVQILPAIRRSLGLPEPRAVALEYDPRLDDIAGSLGLSAIRNDPLGFAAIAVANYAANWRDTLPVRVPMAIYYPRCRTESVAIAADFADLVGPFGDIAIYRAPEVIAAYDDVGRAGIRAIELPRLAAGVFQPWLAGAAFVVSLAGLAAPLSARRRARPEWRALAFAALSLQAGYGLISLGNASFTRYTVVFDPLAILLLTAGGVVAARFLLQPRAEAGADGGEGGFRGGSFLA